MNSRAEPSGEREPTLAFHPIRVETGSTDEEGMLVLTNGGLAGVLVRLSSAIHEGDVAGRWFLEAAFGRHDPRAPAFDTLESADRWFRERFPRTA
jgi:hypothetical protein